LRQHDVAAISTSGSLSVQFWFWFCLSLNPDPVPLAGPGAIVPPVPEKSMAFPPSWSGCGELKQQVCTDLTGVRERFPAQRYSALSGLGTGPVISLPGKTGRFRLQTGGGYGRVVDQVAGPSLRGRDMVGGCPVPSATLGPEYGEVLCAGT